VAFDLLIADGREPRNETDIAYHVHDIGMATHGGLR
jgi:hypothetical protein